jgi:hypothetical protein
MVVMQMVGWNGWMGTMAEASPTDAAVQAIIGVLADPDRRRVLAAIELGATTLHDAANAGGLTESRAAKALARLVNSKVVVGDIDGGLRVDDELFRDTARAVLARQPSDEHTDEPPQRRRILDAFVRHGQITSMPTVPWKRQIVLDWLAATFEVGRRYPEREVTVALEGHAEDAVSLRRALVDAGMLDRDRGEYWRSGGTVD